MSKVFISNEHTDDVIIGYGLHVGTFEGYSNPHKKGTQVGLSKHFVSPVSESLQVALESRSYSDVIRSLFPKREDTDLHDIFKQQGLDVGINSSTNSTKNYMVIGKKVDNRNNLSATVEQVAIQFRKIAKTKPREKPGIWYVHKD
jgi:hypothetical protein